MAAMPDEINLGDEVEFTDSSFNMPMGLRGIVVDKIQNDHLSLGVSFLNWSYGHDCSGKAFTKKSGYYVPYKDIKLIKKHKENQMNETIIKLFPKTADAVLVSKHFGESFKANKLIGILAAGKEADILAAAQALEETGTTKV